MQVRLADVPYTKNKQSNLRGNCNKGTEHHRPQIYSKLVHDSASLEVNMLLLTGDRVIRKHWWNELRGEKLSQYQCVYHKSDM